MKKAAHRVLVGVDNELGGILYDGRDSLVQSMLHRSSLPGSRIAAFACCLCHLPALPSNPFPACPDGSIIHEVAVSTGESGAGEKWPKKGWKGCFAGKRDEKSCGIAVQG